MSLITPEVKTLLKILYTILSYKNDFIFLRITKIAHFRAAESWKLEPPSINRSLTNPRSLSFVDLRNIQYCWIKLTGRWLTRLKKIKLIQCQILLIKQYKGITRTRQNIVKLNHWSLENYKKTKDLIKLLPSPPFLKKFTGSYLSIWLIKWETTHFRVLVINVCSRCIWKSCRRLWRLWCNFQRESRLIYKAMNKLAGDKERTL